MNEADIQKVIDELFKLLEAKISNPYLKLVVASLNTLADGLVSELLTAVNGGNTIGYRR